MTNVLYNEFSNQNGMRNYPFDDSATLTSTIGRVLPVDFFIDISLCILVPHGIPYIRSINTETGLVIIGSDTADYDYGYAAINGSSSAVIYDYEYTRPIGVIIYGPSGINYNPQLSYIFMQEATKLAVATWFYLQQRGIRGFILEDGTQITGNVIFEGRNGIDTHSYYLATTWFDNGRHILKISANGALPIQPGGELEPENPTGIDCIGKTIKKIKVQVYKNSIFRASDYEVDESNNSLGTLAITSNDISAQQLCDTVRTPREDGKPFNYTDICETTPPSPVTPETPDILLYEFIMTLTHNNFTMIAPSSLVMDNPVVIRNNKQDTSKLFSVSTEQPAKSPDALMANQKFLNGNGGEVVIGLKGVKR